MNVGFHFNIALVGEKGKAEALYVGRRREGRREGGRDG